MLRLRGRALGLTLPAAGVVVEVTSLTDGKPLQQLAPARVGHTLSPGFPLPGNAGHNQVKRIKASILVP